MSYNVGQAKKLTCAHCNRGFKLDNPQAQDGAHAFITGGLIATQEGLVYHGYLRNTNNCFHKATKADMFFSPKINEDLDNHIVGVVKEWFERNGPKGCILTKVAFTININYAVPEVIDE